MVAPQRIQTRASPGGFTRLNVPPEKFTGISCTGPLVDPSTRQNGRAGKTYYPDFFVALQGKYETEDTTIDAPEAAGS